MIEMHHCKTCWAKTILVGNQVWTIQDAHCGQGKQQSCSRREIRAVAEGRRIWVRHLISPALPGLRLDNVPPAVYLFLLLDVLCSYSSLVIRSVDGKTAGVAVAAGVVALAALYFVLNSQFNWVGRTLRILCQNIIFYCSPKKQWSKSARFGKLYKIELRYFKLNHIEWLSQVGSQFWYLEFSCRCLWSRWHRVFFWDLVSSREGITWLKEIY